MSFAQYRAMLDARFSHLGI